MGGRGDKKAKVAIIPTAIHNALAENVIHSKVLLSSGS
jgi:hypothetical protein